MLLTKSRKLNRLSARLEDALAVTSRTTGGYNYEFSAAEEFHNALEEAVELLKKGDKGQIHNLRRWFNSMGAWNEFVAMEDKHLGNDIEHLLHQVH